MILSTGELRSVAVTKPDDFLDLCRRPNLANVGTLIARHPNDDAFSLSMSLSLERPNKSDRIWDEINRKLLFDFSDEGLMVRLWPLTFATGNVGRVSAAGSGAEDLSVYDVNPRELVNCLH